jgi:hypothetical protein
LCSRWYDAHHFKLRCLMRWPLHSPTPPRNLVFMINERYCSWPGCSPHHNRRLKSTRRLLRLLWNAENFPKSCIFFSIRNWTTSYEIPV